MSRNGARPVAGYFGATGVIVRMDEDDAHDDLPFVQGCQSRMTQLSRSRSVSAAGTARLYGGNGLSESTSGEQEAQAAARTGIVCAIASR